MRHHPCHQMDLPISKDVYDALLAAAFDTGLEKEYWEIGEAAIRDWMVRNRPDTFPLHGVSGYQWKHLFLPTGTLLRTVFNGRNFHCMVEGDHIYYAGAQVSPSGFVNAIGGTRRSAWKSLWILFPKSASWKLAQALRPKRAVRLARAATSGP